MAKYPVWKYLLILVAVIVGILYASPNLYGDVAAVQVSGVNSKTNLTLESINDIKANLASNNIKVSGYTFDGKTLKLEFNDTDTQLKAREIVEQELGSNYVVALNLLSRSPKWLTDINANPMFLGLDLRGGVHFLEELDMDAAVKKSLNKYSGDIKRDLRNNNIRYGDITTTPNSVVVSFRENSDAVLAMNQLQKDLPNIAFGVSGSNIIALIAPTEIEKIKEAAIKTNIMILHNRVNELGVAEPVIQQQGANRIMVELPGIQDTARAKDILGRTATLEVRMVDDDASDVASANSGNIPSGKELLDDSGPNGTVSKILVNRDVELAGDNIVDAEPGFDENGSPAVNIRLDSAGAAIFKQVTGENIGKRMAMILVDHGKSEVVTAPVIRAEIGGGQVQISGAMDVEEANDVALLLRSGSLAAPMTIIEERTVGPSLGKENIRRGFHSVLWGFAAIAIFMSIYYLVFGLISVLSLAINLLLLIAALSMLQATLTLPGIAAIALALGMAIDSNVLINERIREELRHGQKAHAAIEAGFTHAWATILDSNVTTLIAGLALLAFGTGPIRGFAVVHCLGILTSMFSAVLVSKGIVTLLYAKRRINKLLIG